MEGERHLVGVGIDTASQTARVGAGGSYATSGRTEYVTTGWSDCGHNDWRPGVVLEITGAK